MLILIYSWIGIDPICWWILSLQLLVALLPKPHKGEVPPRISFLLHGSQSPGICFRSQSSASRLANRSNSSSPAISLNLILKSWLLQRRPAAPGQSWRRLASACRLCFEQRECSGSQIDGAAATYKGMPGNAFETLLEPWLLKMSGILKQKRWLSWPFCSQLNVWR